MNTHNYYIANNGTYYTEGTIESQYNGFNILSEHLDLIKVFQSLSHNETWTKQDLYENATILTNKNASRTIHIQEDTITFHIKNHECTLELDPRKIHDFPTFGRNFNIKKIKNGYHINYSHNNFSLHIGLQITCKHKFIENWKENLYSYDKKRNTKPDFYTYQLLKTLSDGIISIKASKQEEDILKFLKTKPKKPNPKKKVTKIKDVLIQRMNELYIEKKDQQGYLAGHPWFFQVWSRDELTGLQAINLTKPAKHTYKLIQKYVQAMKTQNKIPNRVPHSDLASSDATPWFYKRLGDFIMQHGKETMDEDDLKQTTKILAKKLIRYIQEHEENNLIKNHALQTWMDTGRGYDERKGYRIEIQTLTLQALQTIRYLQQITNQDSTYTTHFLNKLQKQTKQTMFKNILHDGLKINQEVDKTTRPNIFLAYYTYPQLLSKKQWEKTFDNALQKLWLSWGALSSIEKQHALYKPRHTGMSNESYHRGDSWYYINNIAAIALYDVNKEKYKKHIQKITSASINDFKNQGYKYSSSEISNAKNQEAHGCFNQFWSIATLYELLHKTKQI